MKSKVFKLTNVTLYAKGWYKQTDNIWDDLKKILELDDYTPFTKHDVFNIIVLRFEEVECRQSELSQVLIGIHHRECWKVGYYTKGNCDWLKDQNLPEYDMATAVIYYILSALRDFDKEQWIIKTPKYTKYQKPEHITIRKIYEMFVLKTKKQ